MSELIVENIEFIALFGFLSLLINAYAWKKGVYRIPIEGQPLNINVLYVLIIFAIFLGSTLFLPLVFGSQLQILTLLATALFLYLYCATLHKKLTEQIWKRSSSTIKHDLFLGAISWVLAFPVVSCIGEICDLIIILFFGEQNYEQTAVQFLKSSLAHPLTLLSAGFTILIAAPIFEEFLFRGVLQNWFKKHLGIKAAIPLTSLFFALFHFSPMQNLGNFSLTVSLFFLGCFLGFIYEKERSLYASIGLHATFNAISTLRIALFPEA